MSDYLAHDYIWAARETDSDDMDAGTFCSVDDGGTKYIRADLAKSQIKAAEAAALMKAAEVAGSLGDKWWNEYKDINSPDRGDSHREGMSDGASDIQHAILALISDDQFILDAYVEAEVNKALDWAADCVRFTERSVSRIAIAATIRAMKE